MPTQLSPDELIECLKVLDLEAGATKSDIKNAYRNLATIFHPDRLGDNATARDFAEEKIKKINNAHDCLKNLTESDLSALQKHRGDDNKSQKSNYSESDDLSDEIFSLLLDARSVASHDPSYAMNLYLQVLERMARAFGIVSLEYRSTANESMYCALRINARETYVELALKLANAHNVFLSRQHFQGHALKDLSNEFLALGLVYEKFEPAASIEAYYHSVQIARLCNPVHLYADVAATYYAARQNKKNENAKLAYEHFDQICRKVGRNKELLKFSAMSRLAMSLILMAHKKQKPANEECRIAAQDFASLSARSLDDEDCFELWEACKNFSPCAEFADALLKAEPRLTKTSSGVDLLKFYEYLVDTLALSSKTKELDYFIPKLLALKAKANEGSTASYEFRRLLANIKTQNGEFEPAHNLYEIMVADLNKTFPNSLELASLQEEFANSLKRANKKDPEIKNLLSKASSIRKMNKRQQIPNYKSKKTWTVANLSLQKEPASRSPDSFLQGKNAVSIAVAIFLFLSSIYFFHLIGETRQALDPKTKHNTVNPDQGKDDTMVDLKAEASANSSASINTNTVTEQTTPKRNRVVELKNGIRLLSQEIKSSYAQNDLETAKSLYEKVLVSYKQLGDRKGLAQATKNYKMLLQEKERRENQNMQEDSQQAIKFATEQHYRKLAAQVSESNEYGNKNFAQGRYDDAIGFYKTALDSASQLPNYQRTVVKLRRNLGDIYRKTGKAEEAIQEYKLALYLAKEKHMTDSEIFELENRVQSVP